MQTVRFDNKGSADPGSLKVQGMLGLYPEMLEKHSGNQGILAGAMLAPYHYKLNLKVLID